MKKFNVTVNGKSYAVEVEEIGAGPSGFTYVPTQPVTQAAMSPQPVQSNPVPQVAEAPKAVSSSASDELITAPMPGTILDIKVVEGQVVKEGDILLILEAMKMENEIVSPSDGVIKKINTSKGATVSTGALLVTIG
ncbi:MAG: biotin/lipoyl-containing protein [Sedimentibacter sp.]